MRAITSASVIVALLAEPTSAADKKPTVTARPNTQLPASKMQAIAPSSVFDVPPRFISGTAPIYPITPLRRGEPGFAVVTFVVDEAGRTGSFKVEKTNYSFFASHAIAAIQNWRFRPSAAVPYRAGFASHSIIGSAGKRPAHAEVASAAADAPQ